MPGRSGEQRGGTDLLLEGGSVEGRLAVEVAIDRQGGRVQCYGDAVAAEGRDHGKLVAQAVEPPCRRSCRWTKP